MNKKVMVRKNLNIPKSVSDFIEKLAEETGMTQSYIVEKAINNFKHAIANRRRRNNGSAI